MTTGAAIDYVAASNLAWVTAGADFTRFTPSRARFGGLSPRRRHGRAALVCLHRPHFQPFSIAITSRGLQPHITPTPRHNSGQPSASG
ncbi:hypothetical protein ACW185_00830 [Limosilactobacillus fermentum]